MYMHLIEHKFSMYIIVRRRYNLGNMLLAADQDLIMKPPCGRVFEKICYHLPTKTLSLNHPVGCI